MLGITAIDILDYLCFTFRSRAESFSFKNIITLKVLILQFDIMFIVRKCAWRVYKNTDVEAEINVLL